MSSARDPIDPMQIAFQEGDHDRALRMFASMPVGVDGYYQALFLKGQILQAQGDKAGAAECFRQAMRHLKTPRQLFHYADFLLDQGEAAKGEAILRRLLTLDPNHFEANLRLGVLLRDRAALDEASNCLARALMSDSRSVLVRYLLAQLCVQRNEPQRALAQLHTLLKIQEDHSPAHRLMGEIYQALGDHRQALVEFCVLANQEARDSELFLRMARSYAEIADRPQHLKCLEWAFWLDDRQVAAGLAAARARDEAQDLKRAVPLYTALLESEHRAQAEEALLRLTGQPPARKAPRRNDEQLASKLVGGFSAPPVQREEVYEPLKAIQAMRTRELITPKAPAPTRPSIAPPPASSGSGGGIERLVSEYVDALAKLLPPERLAELRKRIPTRALSQIKDQVTGRLRDAFRPDR